MKTFFDWLRRRGRLVQWENAARNLNLRYERDFLAGHHLEGERDGVTISAQGQGGDGEYTRFVATGSIPAGLRIAKETASSRFARMTGWDDDLAIGDETFDRQVWVSGRASEVRALLGHEARIAILETVVALGARVDEGKITLSHSSFLTKESEITTSVTRLRNLARVLSWRDRPIDQTLAENAATDPVAGVRLACLKEILARPPSERQAAACQHALTDEDSRLVVLAARRLARADVLRDVFVEQLARVDGGRAGLHPVASGVARADVLRAYASLAPREEAGPLASRALTDSAREVRIAGIDLVGELRWKPALGDLISMLRSLGPHLRPAIARAIGRIGGAGAEPELIALLGSRDLADRRAAARALADAGTAAAVEPLLPHTTGMLTDGELKRLATAAIDAIQSRLQGEGGELALADDPARGALSESESGGAVSLSDRKPR